MTIDKILLASTAIIKDTSNKILLIKRSHSGSFKGYWQLPEGKYEQSESPQDTLIREIKEELNQEVVSLELKYIYPVKLRAKGLRFLFIRSVFDTIINFKNAIKISQEHTDFGWFDKKEAVKKLKLIPGTKEILQNL